MAQVWPSTGSMKEHCVLDEDRAHADETGQLADGGAALTITRDRDEFTDNDRNSASIARDSAVTNCGLGESLDNVSEMRAVRLPIELHERIIGFLDNHWNGSTIAACALVCRAWLPFSRYKLYYIIVLRTRRQWVAFRNSVVQSKSVAIQGYLSMVRELRIIQVERKYLDNEKTQLRFGWLKHQQRPWRHLVLLECAARLKGLTTLTFWHVDLSPSHVAAIRSGRNYHSFTALSLRNTTFASPVQFHQFITAFPALQDLDLAGVEIGSFRNSLPLNQAGHPLKRLEVYGSPVPSSPPSASLVKYFAANTQMLRYLSSFGLDYLAEEEDESWRAITGAISRASLRTLIYEINGVALDISRFTNLTHIYLRIVQGDSVDIEQQIASMHQSVSMISSRLFILSIDCKGWALKDVSSLNMIILHLSALKEVDTVLTRRRFRRLRRFVLTLHISIEFDPTKDPPVIPGVSSRALAAEIASESQTGSIPLKLAAHILESRFRNCAVNAIEFSIFQELKQLNAHGKLDLRVLTKTSDGQRFSPEKFSGA